MTWGASANPNVLYLRACSRILSEARRGDPRRSIETCEECGCLFLTHSSDPHAEVCWPCTRRERDERETEADRAVFARYQAGIGPGNPLIDPEPEARVETELQEVLF